MNQTISTELKSVNDRIKSLQAELEKRLHSLDQSKPPSLRRKTARLDGDVNSFGDSMPNASGSTSADNSYAPPVVSSRPLPPRPPSACSRTRASAACHSASAPAPFGFPGSPSPSESPAGLRSTLLFQTTVQDMFDELGPPPDDFRGELELVSRVLRFAADHIAWSFAHGRCAPPPAAIASWLLAGWTAWHKRRLLPLRALVARMPEHRHPSLSGDELAAVFPEEAFSGTLSCARS